VDNDKFRKFTWNKKVAEGSASMKRKRAPKLLKPTPSRDNVRTQKPYKYEPWKTYADPKSVLG